MFADDTKLFTSEQDQVHLQCDIATLEYWTNDWLLEFNADKCKWGDKSGGRIDIESINEEKDVGVWVTTDLKSLTQCQKASKKAMQTIGMVRRSFRHMTKY